ncbi:MAG: hypothetical protein JO060_06050, partial [Candidatus Eremiobacteraeota bacterium]|nr:hypothetical protein [Candidatus Eremiobacteraeota bacterium]
MRVALRDDGSTDGAVQRLAGHFSVPSRSGYLLRYRTRTGALLRVDGEVTGAFDREHESVRLPLSSGEHDIALDVEKRSLPSSGLPSGSGLRWRWLLAQAEQSAQRHLDVEPDALALPSAVTQDGVPLVGHAHLDVAWLWTYEETRRKAARTFATAVLLLQNDADYVFMQSQPQLYTWVQQDEPGLFGLVQECVRSGRFD